MDTRYSIRPYTPADRETVGGFMKAYFRENPALTEIRDHTIDRTIGLLEAEPRRGTLVVAEADGVPAGYALAWAVWSNEMGGEIIEIEELYVIPERRGAGFGTYILDTLAALYEMRDHVALRVSLAAAHRRAEPLFRREHFEDDGRTSLIRLLSPT